MPSKARKLIIGGDTAFAEIAYEYFTHDSDYEVVAFTVEREYLKREELFGLPILPFETLEQQLDPADHSIYVASVYTQLNRLRTRLMTAAKAKGFSLASYVSSRAFVWRNVRLGEHCFIFEGNVVQPFVEVGNNVVMWSGNHIGHHSTIRDNCFISSHVVISGFVDVGENCFIGVNATVANNLKLGRDCWVGPGAMIVRDAPDATLFKPPKTDIAGISALDRFKLKA
jgi:sugar O-acyltransferase (sialic acid O-acetyltransferase NeuD family)